MTLDDVEIQDVKRVEIRPGDRILVKVAEPLRDLQASQRLRDQVAKWAGVPVDAVVFAGNLDIEVWQPAPAPPPQ